VKGNIMGDTKINGRLRGKEILFVGFKNEAMVNIAEEIGTEGGKLVFTQDGFQALDRISLALNSGDDINLIIMDYPPLEISKVEMLAELLIRDINIPLLVIFEQGEVKYLESFSSKFSSDHIVKPFSSEQFMSIVSAAAL